VNYRDSIEHGAVTPSTTSGLLRAVEPPLPNRPQGELHLPRPFVLSVGLLHGTSILCLLSLPICAAARAPTSASPSCCPCTRIQPAGRLVGGPVGLQG
jgi:hypothetical protein